MPACQAALQRSCQGRYHRCRCKHTETDNELLPLPLTSLSHTPSHQPLPVPKKPKAMTVLPVWQSTRAVKPTLHPCTLLLMRRGFFLPPVPSPPRPSRSCERNGNPHHTTGSPCEPEGEPSLVTVQQGLRVGRIRMPNGHDTMCVIP
jgi:hypothetical protein